MSAENSIKKKPFPWRTIAFFATFLFLAGVVLKRSLSGPPTKPTQADLIRADRVTKPKAGIDERTTLPAGDYVAGNGLIEPADRESKVAGHMQGRIALVAVKEGDFVEAGATLIELDHAAEKAALDAAEGEVAGARAELARTARGLRKEDVEAIVADTESVRARAENSKSTLARIDQLSKSGAATNDELDRAKRQAEIDVRALEASEARKKAAVTGSRAEDILIAQAKLSSATGRREQARANDERMIVRAPIAGRVLQVKTRAGEFYNPNGGEPLVVMGDTRTLRVRVDIDERDIARIKVGSKAFVTCNAFADKRFAGVVTEIGGRMGRKNIRTDDPVERIDTKILEVMLELKEREGLLPGLRVTGYVETSAK